MKSSAFLRFGPQSLFALALLFGAASAHGQDTAATAGTATPAATTTTAMPTLYIISDSTANNNANGGLGWGKPFADYFDPAKVRVLNKAIAARSSRSFIMENHWDPIVAQLQPGDLVLLQFGHNDTGTPGPQRAGDRPSLPGLGEETSEVAGPGGRTVTVHTFGWYMRKYITDAQAKGARIFVLTVTVRDIWANPNATFGAAVSETANIVTKTDKYNPADDRVERGLDDGHGHNFSVETRELAQEQHVPLVDLTSINADKYDAMGREAVMKLFATKATDHTHSNPTGADFNANSIVSGLKALKDSPFLALLSDKGKAVVPADTKYVSSNFPPPPATDPAAAAASATK